MILFIIGIVLLMIGVFGIDAAVRRHQILRQGDKSACVGLQESGQLLVVHLYGLDHADDLQIFLLHKLRFQSVQLFLEDGDLFFGFLDILSDLIILLLIKIALHFKLLYAIIY